jgi:hypothetical protein
LKDLGVDGRIISAFILLAAGCGGVYWIQIDKNRVLWRKNRSRVADIGLKSPAWIILTLRLSISSVPLVPRIYANAMRAP